MRWKRRREARSAPKEHERRVTELSILNEISRALSSALALDELAETVLEQVSRVFDATNFYIAAYQEGSDEWEILLEVDRGERIPPQRYKLGAGTTGHIIRTRQPVVLRTYEESVAFDREQGIELVGDQCRSWMGVPLIARDKLVGVMAVQSYEQEHLYGESDLALFSTIAAQTAIAIENARLYTRLQEQVHELSTPVIPVHDRILVLPLIGTVDGRRAQLITARLLEAVQAQRARVVLVDITGVPLVDTKVAQSLLQAAHATRLVGAEFVLVGVRAEVAQTLVTLGLSMGQIVTKNNLRSGIEYALSLMGLQITSEGE
jgi:anti-anti-sigma factor